MINMLSHIYIIHYHFKKGGVTDVVFRALSAFDNAITTFPQLKKITFVCGSPENIDIFRHMSLHRISINFIIDSSIGYSDITHKKQQSHIHAILKKITQKNSLWWIHNHNLGKNALFTKTLMKYLQSEKQFCFLHLHDFPESARYTNLEKLRNIMLHYETYMGGTHALLAVINKEDTFMLKKAHYTPAYIPNIISFNIQANKNGNFSNTVKRTLSKQGEYRLLKNNYTLFTYPVRCIRRKKHIRSRFN